MITVKDAQGLSLPVKVELTVQGAVLDDHGDHDAWRLSRLRWLDSTIGFDDDKVTEPYVPLVRHGNSIKLLGQREVADTKRDGPAGRKSSRSSLPATLP